MNEISFKDFMECINYKPGAGSEYLWHCYGPDVYALDANRLEDYNQTVSIVYNTNTQFVCEMQAWDSKNNRIYRWIHPDFVEAHKEESRNRGIPFEVAIDDELFIDLELARDILEKGKAILEGKDYDTRVQVEINMPEGELLQMMTMAHEKDMTLNKFVEYILTDIIANAKKG